ncbi:MAG: transposase [Nostoc sp.]
MGVQQVLLSPDKDTKAILEYLCEQSGKLYNSGVYFARQTLFKTDKLLTGKFDLIYESSVSKTQLASSLPSVVAQQTLMSVSEAFKSFKELRNNFNKSELSFKPKPPNYLEGKKLFKIAFPNTGAGKPFLKHNQIRFPLGLTVKRWFGISEFFLSMPINLDFSKVKEFTILPKNGAFYLELSYLVKQENHELDINEALSIDLGTSQNLAACTDTLGNSFLVDSRKLKADNQLWNKRVSTKKEGKSTDYWDSWLDRVTRKRNHQMRDGINKAAKLIIDHCLKNKIGNLVLGWNEGFKLNSNMGNLNNQKFVQMPLGKLKDRLKQLSNQYGITFHLTEEAYTSKSSFLDGDSLPEYGEAARSWGSPPGVTAEPRSGKKPVGWKASGRRILRGLYLTGEKFLINADLNGSANILKKVAGKLELDLSKLSRRCLTTVTRIRLN